MSSPTLSARLTRLEEGQLIAEMAYKIDRIPAEGLTVAIQALTYMFCVVCTILVGLRLYARTLAAGSSLLKLGWDDYLAVAGWVPFIPSAVFCIIATQYGLGAHDSQVPEGQIEYYQARVKEDMIYFELIYFGSSIATKISMALMILRLSTRRRYAYTIWGSMIVMAFVGAGCFGVMFGNCRPFKATWNEKLGYCKWPDSEGWIFLSYFGCTALAVVDWCCAITPFFILQNLQMRKRKKISVQLILGLGLIGSVAGMVRIPYFQFYNTTKFPEESLYRWGHTIIWSVLEAGLGIIACSLPPLRALFGKFYRGSSDQSKMNSSGKLGGTNLTGTKLSSLNPQGRSGGIGRGSNWDRLDDETTSSTEGIIRVTEIRVESSKHQDV